MIKFLRNIRRSLFIENKFSKYLLYAIGEIVLVVIGILIALQINNWNNERQLRKEELKYYQNIKRQLLEDTDVIEGNINFNQRYFEQYQFALEQIATKNSSNLDSLGIIAVNLLEYSDMHKESNIYQSLVNSGEIKLLNNQGIVDMLQRLEESYIYINRIENSHFDIIKGLYPELAKIIRFSQFKLEQPDNIFDYEFENHFVIVSEIMKEKDEIYHKALEEINLILKMIDEEFLNNE